MSEQPDEHPGTDEASANGRRYSAAQQGSNIPLGWKPSRAAPVPVVRCVQIKKDGERCKRWSIRGYTKCRRHAGPGVMPGGNVAKYAEAMKEAGRLRLIDDSDEAIDVLNQLLMPGSSEGIRLKAATEILDRAGIRGGFEVQVEADITANPADEIRKRLEKLAEGAATVERMKAGRSNHVELEDVIDAEVVEEDTDQPTLFDLDEGDNQ